MSSTAWRNTTDPRISEIFANLFDLITAGLESGEKGVIAMEPLPYWPNGLGQFEASRSVKKDLTKLGAKA